MFYQLQWSQCNATSLRHSWRNYSSRAWGIWHDIWQNTWWSGLKKKISLHSCLTLAFWWDIEVLWNSENLTSILQRRFWNKTTVGWSVQKVHVSLPVYHPYRLSLTKTIKHLKNVATLTFDALNTLGCTAIRFWNQISHTSVLYTTNCCHLQPINLKASLTWSMLFCLQPQSTLTTERNWLDSMGHSVLQTKTHLDMMTSLVQYLFEDWFTILNFDGSNLKVTYQINWHWTMLHKPFSSMRPVTHSVGFQIENMLKTC